MAIRLNVGCGRNIRPGWVNLDHAPLPGVDIVYDLENCGQVPLPLENDSVEEFLLSHLIEHIHNTLPLMQELHRVAAPGARALVRVPHGAHDDAWEDPTHVRAYFANSFGYFSQPFYWRADYGYRGDWQLRKLFLAVSKARYTGVALEAVAEEITSRRNVVQEMVAELEAVKPIREPLRELQTQAAGEIVLL